MPRPHKWRYGEITYRRAINFDLPREHARHAGKAEEVGLYWEELEAIRLKDLEGLDQAQAAERMGVSRPTFQRILRSARHKVAKALINGLVLRVDGGHYRLASRSLRCRQCGHRWRGQGRHHERDAPPPTCPMCGSTDIATHHRQSERHSR